MSEELKKFGLDILLGRNEITERLILDIAGKV